MDRTSFVGLYQTARRADEDVHPNIVRSLHRWSLIFIGLWLPFAVFLAYGFSGLSLDSNSPPWVTMALLQLLSLVIAAAGAADILVRIRRPHTSLLYLRKFHAEDREAFPINPFDEGSGLESHSPRRKQGFRLASMLEGVGLLGVRIIALRDARTPGSGHVIFYLMPLYGALMMLAPPVLALFASWLVSIWLASAFGLQRADWDMLAAAVLLALVCLIALWPRAQLWLRNSMEAHSEAVRGFLIRGFRPKNLKALEQVIARARSVGPVAVKSSDANWETFVERLLQSTDLTLFDVRASSDNCQKELELIQRLRLQERVIWLVADPSDISREEERYRVGSVVFPGCPTLLQTPRFPTQSALLHPLNVRHVLFASALMRTMERVLNTRTH